MEKDLYTWFSAAITIKFILIILLIFIIIDQKGGK
jgi:hypothetical protein